MASYTETSASGWVCRRPGSLTVRHGAGHNRQPCLNLLTSISFRVSGSQPSPRRHGFRALAEFDGPQGGGNSDGVIDARDAVFASLRLWRDIDHDGVSQQQELHTLPALGVVRLHLSHKESKRTDEHGNRFKYRARVDDARGAKTGRRAWEVFLVTGQ